MTDPLTALRDLAASCRVRVGTDIAGTPEEGGSGVWIAPGVVLTCAHVVPGGHHSKVQIGWGDHLYTGTVTDQVPAAPQGGLWPYPDLAVIAVDGEIAHPCAWLSEAAPTRDLMAFGYSAELGDGLQESDILVRWSGSHAFGKGRLWQFKGNELVSGMSGGPVLDLSVGAVCGIVVVSAGEGADRGGYLVPVEALRDLEPSRRRELLVAHDRFHRRDRRWTMLRAALPSPAYLGRGPITPAEEVDLLGLLAQFPARDPADLLALAHRSCRDGRMPRSPEMLRDVAYTLLDSAGTDSEVVMSLARMIHYLVGAAPSLAHLDLYSWATVRADQHQRKAELEELREASPAEDAPDGVISVEIAPGAARVDRFRLAVAIHERQYRQRVIYQEQEPLHTLEEVKAVACEQLRTALGVLPGNAYVEFVVPVELFDEPFDELVPTRRHTNLGRKYRVVLRDYERRFDKIAQHDGRKRWRHVAGSSPGIRWITCTEDLTVDEFSAELEQHPETAVLALTRRPSSNAQVSELLQVALEQGMPIAVWRRDTCPEHDAGVHGPSCSGTRFHAAFDRLLSTLAISDLPEAVRMLRNKSAMKLPEPRDSDCLGTVLVWDDPEQTTRAVASVREPPYRPLENAL